MPTAVPAANAPKRMLVAWATYRNSGTIRMFLWPDANGMPGSTCSTLSPMTVRHSASTSDRSRTRAASSSG